MRGLFVHVSLAINVAIAAGLIVGACVSPDFWMLPTRAVASEVPVNTALIAVGYVGLCLATSIVAFILEAER